MAIETREFTPALKEKTPFLVKRAASLVGVKDYLNLRYEQANTEREIRQILDTGLVEIDNLQVEPTDNILVNRARSLLAKTCLPKYLTVRHQGLNQEKVKYTKLRDHWNDDTGVNSIKVEEISNRLEILSNEIFLTERVAEETGIKLDADFSK